MNYSDGNTGPLSTDERTKFTHEDFKDPKWGHIEKREELYSGKAKTLFRTNDPDVLIQRFNDDATAFNGKKKGIIHDKGIYNNKISSLLFSHLQSKNILTHWITQLNEREMLVYKVDIIPLEVVVRNVVAGSLSKKFDIPEGHILDKPIIEYYYKNDKLDDPIVNDDHIIELGLIKNRPKNKEYLTVYNCQVQLILLKLKSMAKSINEYLKEYFDKKRITLVDMKLEFGFEHNRQCYVLADEISPDTCRLWDKNTNEKLDKDRFRRDLGHVGEAYQDVRLRLNLDEDIIKLYNTDGNNYFIRKEAVEIMDKDLHDSM